MILKRFRAESFRNIEECDIEFSPGVNLLYGNNAEGKTNVVEGIYLFARGKSFRAREDRELLSFGKVGFRVGIDYEDSLGKNSLDYAHFGRDRRRIKNGYRLKGVKEMIGSFRAVLFYPDDLSLVKNSPDERRSFLNVAIGQIYPMYIEIYSSYKEALENRSHIIKNANKGNYFDRAELESWSGVMAGYAADIYLYRRKYIEKLEFFANEVVKEISGGKESLTLSFLSDIEKDLKTRDEIANEYKDIFIRNIDKEILVGNTLYGPQRDDMEILLSGVSARSFASQGQQRSIVLALKIAEGEVCREEVGEYPVYLFDDVLSELDEKRKEYILSKTEGKQIIITSCDEDSLILLADKVIRVSGGKYR
ncbi:MAG: DNA replication/repair protein RecF [Clostridia bacterium]|nr:DNA replication/repair protein RecF [Clostridia bacterium]